MHRIVKCIGIKVCVISVIIAAFSGCSAVKPYSKHQDAALKALDEAAKFLDKYGSASISSPLLAPLKESNDRNNPFAYNPAITDNQLFEYARTEASAQSASALTTQFALSVAASAKADIPAIQKTQMVMEEYRRKADAYKAYEDAIIKVAKDQFERDLGEAVAESDVTKRTTLIEEAKNRFRTTSGIDQSLPFPDLSGGQEVTASRPATEAFKNDTLEELGELLGVAKNNQLKTPVRPALLSSVGDKATLGMLSVLVDPAKYADDEGKKFLFGVSMVSVRPGWRTAKDFTADLSIRSSYEYRPARYEVVKKAYMEALDPRGKQLYPDKLIALIRLWNRALTDEWDSEARLTAKALRCQTDKSCAVDPKNIPEALKVRTKAPLVAAVSPIVDVQNMDVFEGARKSIELAGQISAALKGAGYGVAADSFADYARRLEADRQMRGSLPTVVAYSTSGNGFGFVVSPRMKVAMNKDDEPEQAMGLESQGFPVLVLVQMDKDDLGLCFKKDGAGTWIPQEPQLKFVENTRWRQFKKNKWYKYDDEQPEETTVLLRSKVSALGVGMIGFDDLREQLENLHTIEDMEKNVVSKDALSALRKLLDDELVVAAYAKNHDEFFELARLAAIIKENEALHGDAVTRIKNFHVVMNNVLKELQPTRKVLADLLKDRSRGLSVALAGTGNLQALPLETFDAIDAAPKPHILTLHSSRRTEQSGEEVVYDISVVGEHLGNAPDIRIVTSDGKLSEAEDVKLNHDNRLIGFAYKLKKSELPACAVFRIGKAEPRPVCFAEIEKKEPAFEYTRTIEGGSAQGAGKPVKAEKPAKAVETEEKEGGTKHTTGTKWSEHVQGTGSADLLKTAIEKLE